MCTIQTRRHGEHVMFSAFLVLVDSKNGKGISLSLS